MSERPLVFTQTTAGKGGTFIDGIRLFVKRSVDSTPSLLTRRQSVFLFVVGFTCHNEKGVTYSVIEGLETGKFRHTVINYPLSIDYKCKRQFRG